MPDLSWLVTSLSSRSSLGGLNLNHVALLAAERKQALACPGLNNLNLTLYQSHGITGNGLYPRKVFGTVMIRRDELFSHRVDELLPPWAITVFLPGDQQTQPGAPDPSLFLAPSLHLIHPLPFFSVPPFPIYLAPKSPDQLTNAQTKTPAPVLHCQHSSLKRGRQNPEPEDQAKDFLCGWYYLPE